MRIRAGAAKRILSVIVFASLGMAFRLDAQCPTGTTIPNFRFVSGTAAAPRQLTYAWDAPAGAAIGTVYEFLRQTAPDYCSAFGAFQVVAETTSLSETVSLDVPNTAYQFFVRVKTCPQVGAAGTWVDDSFVSLPTAPAISAANTAPGTVTVTLVQNDARTVAQGLERAGFNGFFASVNIRYFSDLCPAGSPKTFDDTALAAGSYSYRAWALNEGTSQRVYSSVETVLVSGGTTCTLDCAAVVPAAAIAAQDVTFRATAGPSGCGGVPTFAWTFGDGGNSTQATADHTYAGSGTYSWTLTVSVADGPKCFRTGTIVIANPAPAIAFFSASSNSIVAGQSVTLSWGTTGATTVQIDPGVGSVNASGSLSEAPHETTTYTLTASNPSGSTSRRLTVTVSPSAGAPVVETIVTVVSAPGLSGAFYRTSLQLNNPSGSAIFGRLIYHPKETSGTDADPSLAYGLAPGQTIQFRDLFLSLGVTGNGSLDVVADIGASPVANARVYDDAGVLGTTGVTERALPASEALAVGDVGILLAPADVDAFRFSIGIRTLASGAVVAFAVKDSSGRLRTTVTRTYPSSYYVQRSATDFLDGYVFTGNESVVATVTAGSAHVYGTVADNTTNDPSIQFARRLP
jgi:PKD repeat protein